MKKTLLNIKSQHLLPVSNLLWVCEKENQREVEQFELLKKYFPETTIEKIILEGETPAEIRKRMTFLYQKYATEQSLKETGIICESPIGYEQWDQFIDFLRVDPPAFFWKIEEPIYDQEKAILLPIDFSQGTDITLPIIKQLVNLEKGKKIILVNLFEENAALKDQAAQAIARNDKKQELQWYMEANFPAEIREGLIIDAIPMIGKAPASYLKNYLQGHNVDLVIMGSRNFNHYHYLLYGSTVVDLLRTEPKANLFVLF